MKLPNIPGSNLLKSLQPLRPALATAGGDMTAATGGKSDDDRGGTMMFASGSDDDGYGGYDDDPPYEDDPPQNTRRAPGAQRGGSGGSGSGGSGGGGRQRSVQFQPEERYWTEYLRIALPIIGLLLMIGLFWFWASQLTNDNDGGQEPVSTQTPGTTEIITPPSTPAPTQAPVVQPTEEPAETPTEETASTPEETENGETPGDSATFAVGDFVVVVDGVNMREEGSVNGALVRELADGEVLEIQSGPVEADDYQWYEVIVESTGEAGWVAADFIEPAE